MARVSATTTTRTISNGFQSLIRMGVRGAAVSTLQQKLRDAGFNPGKIDGVFGSKTLAAVTAFQRARGLVIDGIIGPKTSAKLGVQNNSSPIARTSIDSFSSGGGKVVMGYVKGVARQISLSAIPNGKFMRSDAAAAFNKMYAAAKAAGVHLPVVSGFRSMEQQKHLYSLYKQGRGNLAARPGHSNHQGGIAVDVSVGGSTANKVYKWLAANASKFGFVRTVPSEPWHWEFRR